MRDFVFPLDSVLKLRRVREDLAKQSYVRASRQREEHEHVLSTLGHLRDRAARQLRDAVARGEAGLLCSLGARVQQIDDDLRDGESRLGQLRQAEALGKSHLLDAARARGVVERLRERREEAHRLEQERQAAVQDDELATVRFSRRRGEGDQGGR